MIYPVGIPTGSLGNPETRNKEKRNSMANSMVIFSNAPGGLPLTKQFEAPSNAPVNLFLSGSARTKNAPVQVGIDIELDGKVIGSSLVWCNENESHRALVPVIIPAQFSFGTHTITLKAHNSTTTTDQNDYFNVNLMY
jgi:hypothetical protein